MKGEIMDISIKINTYGATVTDNNKIAINTSIKNEKQAEKVARALYENLENIEGGATVTIETIPFISPAYIKSTLSRLLWDENTEPDNPEEDEPQDPVGTE